MPSSPLILAGAQIQPIASGALHTNRFLSGMWTQRSPFRDAAVPDLYEKFYQASRFESIADGLNMEMTMRLTLARRPGLSVENSNTFAPIYSYYAWKYIQNVNETIRLICDCSDGYLYDFTGGGKTAIFHKGSNTRQARMLGVTTNLFIGDGYETGKIVGASGPWRANTYFAPGTLINQTVSGTPGLFMALGGSTFNIVMSSCRNYASNTVFALWINPLQIPSCLANMAAVNVVFGALTYAGYLNGNTHPINVLSVSQGIITVVISGTVAAPYGPTPEGSTAQGSSGAGYTGSTMPSFSASNFAITTENSNSQQWKYYGVQTQNWGIAASNKNISIGVAIGGGGMAVRYWQPYIDYTALSSYYAILDTNGCVEVNSSGGQSGGFYPSWPAVSAANFPYTLDGTIIWQNLGVPGIWKPSWDPAAGNSIVILDPNGNWQMATGGTTGATIPSSWATTIGASTTDGGVIWICLGPGTTLFLNNVSYSFSLHGIDGTVSTAAGLFTFFGPVVGAPTATIYGVPLWMTINGTFQADEQIDQAWIWRTAQGGSTLLFEDAFPADYFTGSDQFSYYEMGIPDVPQGLSASLNALIQAPIDDTANPVPGGLIPMCYEQQRLWGAVGNTVQWSAGPDALVGNGNTQWPPLNFLGYPGSVIRLVPVTVENGGILVFTTSGIYIILGTGTPTNPYYSTSYCAGINLAGYNALDVFGSVIYLMEANGKVSSITVQYPFNPQSGYVEIGIPIGDQFLKVNTGGIDTALYTPSSTYLSWCLRNTQDTGMYVADGSVGWFRMNQLAPPESGEVWSPRAAIAGGTSAVQTVETSPGVYDLLVGPASSGPILRRDTTTWEDNGTALACYAVFGSIVLAQPGSSVGLRYIVTEEPVVGTASSTGPFPCQAGVLLDEVALNPYYPQNFRNLVRKKNDPPNLPPSQSVASQRFFANQQGQPLECRHLQVMVSWAAQNYPNELWTYSIYARLKEKAKR